MTGPIPIDRASKKQAAQKASARYGTKGAAAKSLGINRSTLRDWLNYPDEAEASIPAEARIKERERELEAALARTARDANAISLSALTLTDQQHPPPMLVMTVGSGSRLTPVCRKSGTTPTIWNQGFWMSRPNRTSCSNGSAPTR